VIETIAFYIFAFAVLFFAIQVVRTEYVMRAAMSLICVLMGTAALYLLANAEFAAAVQILVYVGGIVVLIIFAVLLVHNLGEARVVHGPVNKFGALALSLALFMFTSTITTMDILLPSLELGPTSQYCLVVDTHKEAARKVGLAFLSHDRPVNTESEQFNTCVDGVYGSGKDDYHAWMSSFSDSGEYYDGWVPSFSNSKTTGGYVVPFELLSLVLLAALIGSTAIARIKVPYSPDSAADNREDASE